MEQAIEKINTFFIENGGMLLRAILILVIGIIVINIVLAAIKKGLKKQSKIDPIMIPYIRSSIKVILYLVLFLWVASELGFSMTSLVTLLGVVGLAVSLALQNSLSNMINGIFIMLSKPFARGEFVSIDGVDGTVQSIGLIYTKLKTIDKQVLIPNSDVANAKIFDLSVLPERRQDIAFTVSHDSDIDHVRSVVLAVVKDAGELSKTEPEPAVVVTNLSTNGIEMVARVWVTPENYWPFRNYIFEALKKAFDREGIVIPRSLIDVALTGQKS